MKSHITQLFAVLLGKGDYQRLALLVDQSEKQFTDPGQHDVWCVWKGQALIGLGKPEEALQILPTIEDPEMARHLETLARRGIAQKTGEKKQLAEYLHTLYQQTRDGLILFEWAELKAAEQDWGAVALHAEDIVHTISTAQALRLAAFALFNAGKPAKSLEFLNSGIHFFPNAQLPADLRRVRIACQQRLGLTQQAIKEAEALATETGQIQDKANLITIRLTSGDPKGANLVAREFLGRTDVKPEHLLQLADTVRGEDLSLAQALLTAAVSKGELSPELAPAAVNLAFTLNREDLLPKLFPGFLKVAHSSAGPIKAMSLAEVREMIQSSGKRREELDVLYRRGRLPLHFIIEEFGHAASLSSILHRCFHPQIGAFWQSRPRVYIRHGGRLPQESKPKRLYVDTSALLVAAELDILTEIENAYAPVFLPPNISQILLADLNRAAHPQPSRLDNAKEIQKLIESRELSVFDVAASAAGPTSEAPDGLAKELSVLIRAAKENGGYLGTFLPLTKASDATEVNLPESLQHLVAGVGSILITVVSAGKLSQKEEASAREYLKSFLAKGPARTLSTGHPLFLSHGIADCLAAAGVLRATTECFKVSITNEESLQISYELGLEDWSAGFRAHLKGLIERVRRGLESGKYQLLPIQNSMQEETAALSLNPASDASVYLLHAEPMPGAAVWVDDRMLNSFSRYGEIPTTDVVDMLSGLRSDSRITEEQHYQKLQLLRDSNLRYIPISSEEILFWLKPAKLENGEIVETPELASLRKAAASHLLEGITLQKPGDEGVTNPFGETLVVMGLYRAAYQAVVEIWKTPGAVVAEATAKADWVLQNILFDVTWLTRLLDSQSQASRADLPKGMFLAHLFAQGISLYGKRRVGNDAKEAPRDLYFRWLVSRFEVTGNLQREAGKQLRRIFETDFAIEAKDGLEKQLKRHLLGDLYDDLPPHLKACVQLSSGVIRRMGIRQYYAVETPAWKFDARTFWRAAARAIRKGETKVTTKETQKTFVVRAAKNRPDVLQFISPNASESFGLSDPAFEALARERSTRESALIRQLGWFDKPFPAASAQIKRIVEMRNPAERMRQIHFARRTSPAAMEEKLKGLLSRGEKVHLSDMEPPPTLRLLQHLRIPPDISSEDVANAFSSAAEELTKELGFAAAFVRFSTLPVRLPNSIIAAFQNLTEDEKRAWATTALQEQTSFVSKLHILEALTIWGGEWAGGEAAKLLEWLASKDGEMAFDAFSKVLLWSLYQLEEQNEKATSNPGTLLAASWVHASRLYNTIHPFMPDRHIVGFFSRFCDPRMGEVFSPKAELRGDIAYPRRLSYEAMVIHGLSLANWNTAGTGMPAKAASSAIALSLVEHNGVKVPKLALLNDPALHYNCLTSFLGGNRAEVLAALIGTDTAQLLGSEQIRKETVAAISALIADPKQETQWIILNALSGPKLPEEPVRRMVGELVKQTAFTDLLVLDPNVSRVAMFWLTIQTGLLGDVELCRKNREDILSAASRWGNEGSKLTKERDAQRIDTLLEVIHFATRSGKTPEDNAKAFCDLLLAVQQAWPSASNEFWTVIKKFAFRIPESELLELSPAIVRLREAAF